MNDSGDGNRIVLVITPPKDYHIVSPEGYPGDPYDYWRHSAADFRIFANVKNAKKAKNEGDRVFDIRFDPGDPTANAVLAVEVE